MQRETNLDIVKLVLNSDGSTDGRKLDNLIVQYLVSGSCPTRLGEEIKLLDEDSKDKTLDTLPGILRIICEHTWETKNPEKRPWRADDTSDSARRFIKYESKAGELGDRMAISTGRAAAMGATGLINQLVTLPDEISTLNDLLPLKSSPDEISLQENASACRMRIAAIAPPPASPKYNKF